MNPLLKEIKDLIGSLPIGVNSDHHRSEIERLTLLAGEIRTVEHRELWYELIWCRDQMIEEHRLRVLDQIFKMIEHPEWTYTPLSPIPAPQTWSEARMLALKKNCPDCQWWHSGGCGAHQLVGNGKAAGLVPESISVAMRDCRRDAEDNKGSPVQNDPRLG